jgi:hypothetical protein
LYFHQTPIWSSQDIGVGLPQPCPAGHFQRRKGHG